MKQTQSAYYAAAIMGILFILLNTVSAFPAPGGIVIIANSSVKTGTLTKEDIKEIYLGKKNTWSNGDSITFVTLKSGKTHENFIREFTGKTDIQYRTYWKKLVFTGMGTAPITFDAENKMIDYVANTSGAIGYVSTKPEAKNIKIITVSEK